jgi:hypothetical protein
MQHYWSDLTRTYPRRRRRLGSAIGGSSRRATRRGRSVNVFVCRKRRRPRSAWAVGVSEEIVQKERATSRCLRKELRVHDRRRHT